MSQSPIADVSTAVGSPLDVELPDLVVALTIVSHPVARRAGERYVLDRSGEALLQRNAPDFVMPGHSLGAPLDDPFVSRRPIRFVATPHSVRLSVEPGGTQVVVGTPVHGSVEIPRNDMRLGVPIELAGRVVLLLHLVERRIEASGNSLGMVGTSAGIRRVRSAIERVADLNVPVLIRGETGTGKELVARAIHARGLHQAGPFVPVNMGAITRDLAAAELFGATRGAYTGAARDRDGLFRTAHEGTLFLDEVGEAAPEIQVMLLRVLETGEIHPVGADRPVAVQVRLIAATDANLEEKSQHGQFRAPLLYRLASYEIRIPPLRERREDIGPLFFHFAHEELAATGETHRLSPSDQYANPWLPASIAAQLVRHPWPGNLRELRNITRKLVIGSRGLPQLDLQLAAELGLAPTSAEEVPLRPPSDPHIEVARRRPSEVSPTELLEALQACAWDLKAAADRLRIPRPSIYDLIERSPDIRTAGDIRADEIEKCFRDCGGDVDAMVPRLRVSKRALSRRLRELGLVRPRSARPGSDSD